VAERLRVLLVDDHSLFRGGLSLLLASADASLSIREAASLDAALEELRANVADVVLLEVGAAGEHVIEAVDSIVTEQSVPVLLYSKHPYDDQLVPALQAGACGYVPNTSDIRVFVDYVRRAARGEYCLDAALAKQVVLRLRELAATPPQPRPDELSVRERQVLAQVASGATNRAIASALGISESTVKNHMSSIFRKLDVSSRSQATAEAIRRGFDRPLSSAS
jgi:DNA-binding NarL/FixJ family response regulator